MKTKPGRAVVFAASLMLAAMSLAHAGTAAAPQPDPDNGCSLRAPQALLLPHAYPGQTALPGKENTLVEAAVLAGGVRLRIERHSCVDGVSTELVLLVPGSLASDRAAIDLLRTTIEQLKWDRARADAPSLLAFLQRAPALPLRKGVRSVCNDDSIADPGDCSWESNGGFVLSIKRGATSSRISFTATNSA